MALEPLSIKNMEEKTQDIYEAVVIMSKRAKQILSDRVVDEMISSAEEEVELGVYDQVVEKTPEDYEELEKVTTLAVNEFVDGDIEWTHGEEEAVQVILIDLFRI